MAFREERPGGAVVHLSEDRGATWRVARWNVAELPDELVVPR
jgi:hypothetical protein